MKNDAHTEDKILLARLSDMIDAGSRGGIKYLGFVDERQRAVAGQYLKSFTYINYMFYGGFEHADRVLISVSADYIEVGLDDFPISPVTFKFKSMARKLTHRDFLGALMSMGIKREVIGDIVVSDNFAVVFLRSEIADSICRDVLKVGAVGVRGEVGLTVELPNTAEFKEFSGTIASLRFDCVVSQLCGISRSKAATMIVGGICAIDHLVCVDTSKQIKQSQVITVRGVGKFVISECDGLTKKGRVKLSYKKYI